MRPEICITVATTPAEIAPVLPFWEEYNAHPESAPGFVEMLGSVRQEIAGPFVLVACRDKKPVSLMIGRIENACQRFRLGYWTALRIPVRRMIFVRDGFLGERSREMTTLLLDKIFHHLNTGSADCVQIDGFPLELLSEKIPGCSSPSLPKGAICQSNQHWKSELPDSFEAFLCKRSSKSRYNLMRSARIFETEFTGKIRIAIFHSVDDVAVFCEKAEIVARKTYQRAMGAGFVDNEENRLRVASAAKKGVMRAYMTFLDDQPVAFWYGEMQGKTFYLMWTGFDPAYGKFDVGTLLFLKMVEDLIALGVAMIDYGPGWALYKERFGDVCLQELDITLYAANVKGYFMRLLQCIETKCNQAAKGVLERMRLRERVKKLWRKDLAKKETEKKAC